MENLPVYIALLFGLITATTIFIFYFAANRSRKVLAIIIGWLLVNTILAVQGFYTITDTMPPRFILAIGLPLLSIGILFATKNGQRFINNLNLRYLTLLHIIEV